MDAEEVRYRFRTDRRWSSSCLHNEEVLGQLALPLLPLLGDRKGSTTSSSTRSSSACRRSGSQYAEGWYAEQLPDAEVIKLRRLAQRRCPHLKADLTRFGIVETATLTCQLHGWQFDLASGRCLTSDDRQLYSVPLEVAAEQ